MFGTAYLMTKDHGLAEDAMQEALLQMWKHLPSLRQGVSLKAWLIRIVVNEVNRQRRKKRVANYTLEYAPELADDCDDTATTMIRNEDHQNLRQALELLPKEVRETVYYGIFPTSLSRRLQRSLENRKVPSNRLEPRADSLEWNPK